MSDCRKCVAFEWCRENEECGLFKPKTMTNADKVRQMSDNELAAHMVLSVENALLRFANVRMPVDLQSEYISYWLRWLKQEVGE